MKNYMDDKDIQEYFAMIRLEAELSSKLRRVEEISKEKLRMIEECGPISQKLKVLKDKLNLRFDNDQGMKEDIKKLMRKYFDSETKDKIRKNQLFK